MEGPWTIAIDVAKAGGAGLAAWGFVRLELTEVRRRLHHGERIFTWLAANFMVLAQAHNKNHPGGPQIDVSGLAQLLFEARNSKSES